MKDQRGRRVHVPRPGKTHVNWKDSGQADEEVLAPGTTVPTPWDVW